MSVVKYANLSNRLGIGNMYPGRGGTVVCNNIQMYVITSASGSIYYMDVGRVGVASTLTSLRLGKT